MDKELELMAYNGEPIPKGRNWRTIVEYIVSRYLYAANRIGAIEKGAAKEEKRSVIALIQQADENREFERKCWENSARRTISADRAMMVYRQNRTLENADALCAGLEWLHDECTRPVKWIAHGANCPNCGKYFNKEHSDRQPAYCEDCGCHLGWSGHESD